MNVKRLLQYLCFTLIILLVFEGLLRKILPGLSMAIFLAKDVLLLLGIPLLIQLRSDTFTQWLSVLYCGLVALMIIPIGNTISYDPLLAVFGAKQYLLYPLLGLYVIAAFRSDPEAFDRFANFGALLIYPVVTIALIQRQLPEAHWLNLSVGGGSMSAFSSGGTLRVSSTFSFVAQFSWFTVAACFLLPAGVVNRATSRPWKWLFVPWVLFVFLFIGLFATGSRTAVIGCVSVFIVATSLIFVTGRSRSLTMLVSAGIFTLLALIIVNVLLPDVVRTYSKRFESRDISEQTVSVANRVSESLTSWQLQMGEYKPSLLGYGLGTMSNGVQNISPYAARVRNDVWGESDLRNIMLEGGYYLLVVWIGFRVAVIALCVWAFLQLGKARSIFPAAFALGHVIVIGLTATLGTQPPWALWWWLSVAWVITINRIESYERRERRRSAEEDVLMAEA